MLPSSLSARQGRWLPIALSLSLAILAFVIVWEQAGPGQTLTIRTDGIQHLEGQAYATRVDAFPAWLTHAQRPGETRLHLSENGQDLIGANAPASQAIREGRGRYLSPSRWLVFSASDNSDPRSNNRVYEARLFPGLPLPLIGALVLIALFLATLMATRLPLAPAGLPLPIMVLVHAGVAVLWTWGVLEPAPQIVTTGDGGNVASIVAARLFPERFIADPVFGRQENFAFYRTMLIPATMAATRLTGDIGQAYMLLSAPLVFIQLIGFHLLGRRLFGGTLFPALLALASLAPIYVFNGELWGMLGSPLTRSAYAAILPFLLLGALGEYRPWQAYALMILCGLAVYIHPVSAPSAAFGILMMLLVARPGSISWPRHLTHILLSGVVFLALALPFALTFADVFPGSNARDTGTVAIAHELLRANVGPQYYNANHALYQVAAHFWFGALIVAIATPFIWREPEFKRLAAFAAGIFATSYGIAIVDQTNASLRGTEPVQIDLIRNVRFFVPVVLVAAFWAAARVADGGGVRRMMAAASAVTLACALWLAFPTPLTHIARNALLTRHAADSASSSARAILKTIAALPANSMIIPLPHRTASEGVELIGLAVRYGGRAPVAFLVKDMNFLTYSSSEGISTWLRTARLLDASVNNVDVARKNLVELIGMYRISHVLLNTDYPDALAQASLEAGEVLATEGPWRLVRVNTGH